MLRIKILYDNRSVSRRFTYAWGFSCFIEGMGENILFDTGGMGDVLLHNMEEMGVQVDDIEHIFLSHIHGDHTGGLVSILQKKGHVTVWLPDSFPESAKFDIASFGARVKGIDSACRLFDHVYSTGQLGRSPKEQAMILDTEKGLILITGCAHPGITNMAVKTANYMHKSIYLVLGGFHMRGYNKNEIEHIIKMLKELNIKKIAPCHCTGEYAMELFEEHFKENYIDAKVGSIIEI